MLFIAAAILLAALILRCVDQSGLSPIGQILVILLIIILLVGLPIVAPESQHYLAIR